MHPSFRLLPLSLCIAVALPAYAAEDVEDWGLCPIEDAVPAFADVPVSDAVPEEDRTTLPTDIAGRALVVHEKPDDYHSQPSGDAGSRVACGVITILD